MANTYKKALKTVVFTLVDGSTVTATDTVSNAAGSEAYGMYKAKSFIVVQGDSSFTEFHFDMVVKAVVTVSASDDITKADPYCDDQDVSE